MEQTKTLIDFIFQYGVGFVCVAYLIYDKLVNAKENQKAMKEIVDDNKKTNLEKINFLFLLRQQRRQCCIQALYKC